MMLHYFGIFSSDERARYRCDDPEAKFELAKKRVDWDFPEFKQAREIEEELLGKYPISEEFGVCGHRHDVIRRGICRVCAPNWKRRVQYEHYVEWAKRNHCLVGLKFGGEVIYYHPRLVNRIGIYSEYERRAKAEKERIEGFERMYACADCRRRPSQAYAWEQQTKLAGGWVQYLAPCGHALHWTENPMKFGRCFECCPHPRFALGYEYQRAVAEGNKKHEKYLEYVEWMRKTKGHTVWDTSGPWTGPPPNTEFIGGNWVPIDSKNCGICKSTRVTDLPRGHRECQRCSAVFVDECWILYTDYEIDTCVICMKENTRVRKHCGQGMCWECQQKQGPRCCICKKKY